MHADETLVPGDGGTPGSHGAGLPRTAGGIAGALEEPGAEVGPYRLVRLLGEGGFGTVWLAERRHPFVQQVALKIVKAGMDSKAVVARFEQERQALAVMNHPNVAKVLDGGLTALGRPYFAMEYVKGSPINEFCDRRTLPVNDRLTLFLQVCDAVQHAHTKGIIHRDLKPSNILVSQGEDDQPSAKVIDFGIAKAVTGRMTEQTLFTENGQMIGTPEYMSPEQADPGETDIDTRTDVYSLGVILYELLSGALPFDPKDLRSRAYREIQRVIREDDPPAPSARLSTIATKDAELATRIGATRRQQVGALATLLRTELEWIPLKAMRKDRQERYDSPADLGRDVENYLAGRPLVAAPESAAYRVRKYVRRNRGMVVATGTVLAALVLGLAIATWQWAEASAARAEADARRADSEVAQSRAEAEAASGASYRAWDAASEDNLTSMAQELDLVERLGWKERFHARWLRQLEPKQATADSSVDPQLLRDCRDVELSADGLTAFSVTSRTGQVLRIETGTMNAAYLPGIPGIHATCIGLSPDGTRLGIGTQDGQVLVLDAMSGAPVGRVQGIGGSVWRVVPSDAGNIVLAAAADQGAALVLDALSGRILHHLDGHNSRILGLRLSPNQALAATTDQAGTVRLWEVSTGKRVAERQGEGRRRTPVGLGFDRSGDRLAVAQVGSSQGYDEWSIEILSVPDLGRTAMRRASESISDSTSLVFVDKGRQVISAAKPGAIQRWSIESQQVERSCSKQPTDSIAGFATLPDGSLTLTATGEGPIQRFRAPQVLRPSFPQRQTEFFRWVGFRETSIAYATMQCAVSPDGSLVASSLVPHGIQVWDSDTGRPIALLPTNGLAVKNGGRPCGACFGSKGRTLVAGDGPEVVVWEAPCWIESRRLRGGSADVHCVASSADGRSVVAGTKDGSLLAWELSGDQPLRTIGKHAASIEAIALSPVGDLLASADGLGNARLTRMDNGTTVAAIPGLGGNGCAVAFSADGKLLFAGSSDGVLRAVRTADGSEAASLEGLGGAIVSISTASDGTIAVCTTVGGGSGMGVGGESLSSSVVLLDAVSLRRIAALRGSAEAVTHTAFDAASTLLALASGSGRVALLRTLPMPEAAERRARKERAMASARTAILAWCNGAPDDRFVDALPSRIAAQPGMTDDERHAFMLAAGTLAEERNQLDAAVRERASAGDIPGALFRCRRPAATMLPAGTLNDVAWQGLESLDAAHPARDLFLLRRLAEQAAAVTNRKDGAVLDTLARAYWELGDRDAAVREQQQAVAAVESLPTPATDRERRTLDNLRKQVREALDRYQAAAPVPPEKSRAPN